MEQILLKHKGNSLTLDEYKKQGGYQALPKALQMDRSEIIDEVKKASIRGRGGAGFPAGVKWGFIPKKSDLPIYLCCNADEGEPGTFKDREIMTNVPHMLLEGMVIACHAIGSSVAYIYIRGEFSKPYQILKKAIEEAYENKLLGENILGTSINCDIFIHRGRGAYICGEETALIESIEGKRGHPRLKPPFPAIVGLFGCPTLVNNVETLANIPHVINNGAPWFTKFGINKDHGTRLFGVSGHVEKPGVYELPIGTKLCDIVDNHAGGVWKGRKLKAIIPGGSSTPILKPEEIDCPMDCDSVIKAGSMIGSGAIIVMDETTCMVKILHVLARFYAHESCGQCSQCRMGSDWAEKILARILNGKGKKDDIDLLLDIAKGMEAKTVCPFSDALAMPIRSFLTKFRGEFEYHITHRKCDMKK